MTRTITIADQKIKLYEHPKHRAVQQVQDIMTTWMLEKVDMSTIDQDMELEDAIKQALMNNPKLASEITPMQRTLPLDQTIMLATNMSYKELQAIADDMTEAEYIKLYEESKKTIGGTANDFFGVYSTGIVGTMETMKPQDPETLPITQEP
jgi:NCAIR mutase (PurE)-related protein